MVDKEDVLRQSPSERKLKENFERRMKAFAQEFKEYEPPTREALETAVEDTTKCGKCAGGVRAVMENVQPSNAFAYDLEILVSLNCRDGACGWTARQWRTWVRTKPLEL